MVPAVSDLFYLMPKYQLKLFLRDPNKSVVLLMLYKIFLV